MTRIILDLANAAIDGEPFTEAEVQDLARELRDEFGDEGLVVTVVP